MFTLFARIVFKLLCKLFYFKAFFLAVSLDIRSQAVLYQKLKKKKTARGSIRRRLHTTKGLS